jgi:hypothetical protein
MNNSKGFTLIELVVSHSRRPARDRGAEVFDLRRKRARRHQRRAAVDAAR